MEKPTNEMTKQELWGIFFKCTLDRDKRQVVNEILRLAEAIAMAGALLQTLSEDDHTRARLITEYKNAVDLQSKMVSARRKGWREGLEKGLMEGLQEGEKKGRLEALGK